MDQVDRTGDVPCQPSRRNVLRAAAAMSVAGTWSLAGVARAGSRRASVVLPVAADTYADAKKPSTAFGAAAELLADESAGNQRISYLRFAITDLDLSRPTTLRLHGAHASESVTGIGVYPVAETGWTEQSLTWANRPPIGTAPLDARRIGGLRAEWYEWDVTRHAHAARERGETSVVFAVQPVDTTRSAVTFASGEAAAWTPKLISRAPLPEAGVLLESQVDPGTTWRFYRALRVSDVAGFTPPGSGPALSAYGGLLSVRRQATGRFRTERYDDRWWLVDPSGYLYYAVGLASTRPPLSAASLAVYRRLYANDDAWAASTIALMTQLGFNGTGAFSANDILRRAAPRKPYTTSLKVMGEFAESIGVAVPQYGNSVYRESAIPVFHPDFERRADAYVADRTLATKDDPYLLGHFTDNELPMPADGLTRLLTNVPLDDPDLGASARAAWDWYRKRYGAGADPARATEADNLDWLGFVMDRYYSIAVRLLRKHAPGQLVLGSRLHSRGVRLPQVVAAAGRHLDVVSFNYYERWEPRETELAMYEQNSPSAPVLISEFYTKGEDSGLENTKGAGWVVRTQADRGTWYQNFTLRLLQHPHTVGWNYFKYQDEVDDSNKGLLSFDFVVYEAMTAKVRELNRVVYPLLEHFSRQGG